VDLYAAGLSTLCLLHCLALPLLASLLPIAGQLSENEALHRGLVLLAAPATLWVVWRSLQAKGGRLFLLLGPTGLGLLTLAAFAPPFSAYERPMTVIGALVLAAAHLWRLARHHRSLALRHGPPRQGSVQDG